MVSAFYALGHKPEDIFKDDNEATVYFAFEDYIKFNALSDDYYNRRLQVDAMDMFLSIKQVRSDIFNVLKEKKDVPQS